MLEKGVITEFFGLEEFSISIVDFRLLGDRSYRPWDRFIPLLRSLDVRNTPNTARYCTLFEAFEGPLRFFALAMLAMAGLAKKKKDWAQKGKFPHSLELQPIIHSTIDAHRRTSSV